MHPRLPTPATMLPAPERAEGAGSTAALGRPVLLGWEIQGLSMDLPVQLQLLTPRGGVLAALGGRKSGLPPPHSWPLDSAHLHSVLRSSQMPLLLGEPPEPLLSHCTAISFPRQGCLPPFGCWGHQGPERGVSLPRVTQQASGEPDQSLQSTPGPRASGLCSGGRCPEEIWNK